MLLKSIDIHGFKSFPDKTVLHFGKGITAVVGPNGSGKSNISDAVRWVLGEQSTKTLRGQKMEDVVFGGTATRRSQGYAEVTLRIDNADRCLNFDNDTVAITRRYYRSGESEYHINQASVRLKDIHELFMDTGLGRDGYSMIGQGKIDSIVGSKSADRRDIFEEASGISRFRYRKQEAERRLERAEENLVRLRDIMSELEVRIGPLKEQSEKAAEFLEYSHEKKDLEIGLWLHTLSRSKESLREQDYKITLAEQEYRDAGKEIEEIDNQTAENAVKLQELAIEIDEIRRAASECEESAARTEGEIAVMENTIFHNEESAARFRAEIETLSQSDESAADIIKERQKLSGEKSAQLDLLNLKLNEANEQLRGLIAHSESYSLKIEAMVKKLNVLSADAADQRVRQVTAESSLSEMDMRRGTVSVLKIEQEKVLEELGNEYTALRVDDERLRERILECTNSVNGYKMRRESREKKAEQIKAELEKLRLDIGERERRAQILEDLEKNMEGFAFSVKTVMKEAKGGALRGIHGPVSRLVNAPKEYSAAIETALGASMQNIVVDSEEDAKRAISFLKNKNAGRSTFLPITSIKGNPLREQSLQGMDGFIGMAADLIQYDAKYSGIINSLLGRVAVAEDMNCAVSIARKFSYRFKIVTLDGQVVNAGGSLTGGSMAKNAGLLGRGDEIARLRAQAASLSKALLEKTAEHKDAVSELAAVDANIAGASGELTTAGEDRIRVSGELRRVGEQIEAAKASLSQMDLEIKASAEREVLLERTIHTAKSATRELEQKMSEVQSEIDKASGGRENVAGRREELTAAVTACKLEIIETRKDLESVNLSVSQLKEDISGRAERIASLLEEINSIVKRNADISGEITDLKGKAVGMREKSARSEEEIASLFTERSKTEQRSNELRLLDREKSENRERISGELARLSEKKSAMMKEHDDVIAKLYDEYELTRSEAEATGIIVEEPAKAGRRLSEIKNKIKALGNVNVGAIEEYKEVGERYEFMSAQIADVEQSRDELYSLIDKLTVEMREMFSDGFEKIAKNFTKVFTDLFGGGTAELKLTDPDNVLESGIDILVQPPGKKVSTIELLSGGEKALIAVSIYFAIMTVNPPPFCMMDEVESALDDVNVDRFAEYMHHMSDTTQFICITHRRGTMEAADVLYGVTMQEKGVSKLLQLNVTELEKKLSMKI